MYLALCQEWNAAADGWPGLRVTSRALIEVWHRHGRSGGQDELVELSHAQLVNPPRMLDLYLAHLPK
jgi:hypothetical protein